MSITPINTQSTSKSSVQNQEQQLMTQIKNLQAKDKDGNAAQIKILQNKYNALLLQQQQQLSVSQTPQKSPEVSSAPSAASPAPDKGINIKV